MKLWKIIHPDIPFCFFLADTADKAVADVMVGLLEPAKFTGIEAVPLTLDDIVQHLKKEHAERETPIDGFEFNENEISGTVIFGVDF